MIFPLWVHWTMLGDIFGCHNKGEGEEASGALCVEDREAGTEKCTGQSDLSPTKKN